MAPLLLLLAILLYLPGLSGGFVYDDGPNIVDNPQIHMQAFSWRDLAAASFSSESGQLHRPVAIGSLALTRHFFGNAPLPFKLFNLAIHLACGLVLLFLTHRFLTLFRVLRAPDLPPALIPPLTFFVTCAWLVHPVNLTPVLYVVQRMTSLSALFLLAGCLFFLEQRRQLREGEGSLPRLLAGEALFLVLSVLSKENGVLLPLFLLVLEGTLFRFRRADGRRDRRALLFFVLFLVLPGLMGTLFFLLHQDRFLSGFGHRAFTLGERLLTEARVLFFYLRLILLPSNQELGLFHDDFPISRGVLDPVSTLPAVVAWGLLPVLGVRWLKTRPLLGMAILWFLAAHLLESTIFPLILVFEHRNYVALWGLLPALGHFLLHPPLARRILPVWHGGAMIFLILLALVTLQRSMQWGQPLLYRLMEADNHPRSAIATLEAGRYLAETAMAGGREHAAEAKELLERSATLSADTILAESALVMMTYKLQGDPDPAWIASMERKLSDQPVQHQSLSSLISLVHCQEKKGCRLPVATLSGLFDRVMANPRVGKHTALAHTARGIFQANLGRDPEAALISFQNATRAQPGQPQYHVNLARLALAMGRWELVEKAVADLARWDRFGVYWRDLDSLRRRLEQRK